MIIYLSPVVVFDDSRISVYIDGERISINGKQYDLSPLGEGDSLPRAAFPDGDIFSARRDAGDIHIEVKFPIPLDANEEARFPVPIVATGGDVDLPLVLPAAHPPWSGNDDAPEVSETEGEK